MFENANAVVARGSASRVEPMYMADEKLLWVGVIVAKSWAAPVWVREIVEVQRARVFYRVTFDSPASVFNAPYGTEHWVDLEPGRSRRGELQLTGWIQHPDDAPDAAPTVGVVGRFRPDRDGSCWLDLLLQPFGAPEVAF